MRQTLMSEPTCKACKWHLMPPANWFRDAHLPRWFIDVPCDDCIHKAGEFIQAELNNITEIEWDGIDFSDLPDCSDAYISYAEWRNTGAPLNDDELDKLNSYHRDYFAGSLYNDAVPDALASLGDSYE